MSSTTPTTTNTLAQPSIGSNKDWRKTFVTDEMVVPAQHQQQHQVSKFHLSGFGGGDDDEELGIDIEDKYITKAERKADRKHKAGPSKKKKDRKDKRKESRKAVYQAKKRAETKAKGKVQHYRRMERLSGRSTMSMVPHEHDINNGSHWSLAFDSGETRGWTNDFYYGDEHY